MFLDGHHWTENEHKGFLSRCMESPLFVVALTTACLLLVWMTGMALSPLYFMILFVPNACSPAYTQYSKFELNSGILVAYLVGYFLPEVDPPWFIKVYFRELQFFATVVFIWLLQQERGNLYLTVKTLVKQSKRHALRQSAFLATMSHEIRTPLLGILGWAELLRSGPQEKEILDNLIQCSTSLQSLICDILDFEKISVGKVSVENAHFDVKSLIRRVPKLFPIGTAPYLELSVGHLASTQVIGDVVRIKQCLVNLITNANKFTHVGHIYVRLQTHYIEQTSSGVFRVIGSPCISEDPMPLTQILEVLELRPFSDTSPKAGYNDILNVLRPTKRTSKSQDIPPSKRPHLLVLFEVLDTGIGIAKEDLDNLFQPFTQVDPSETRKYGGSGLGLFISYQLISAMRGRISVASQPGMGSAFCFSVILEEAPPRAPAVEGGTPVKWNYVPPSQPILVAEDNVLCQKLVRRYLDILNVPFKMVTDGVEALTEYKTGQYSLLLLDNHMPSKTGIQALSDIRQTDTKTPVIIMTADTRKAIITSIQEATGGQEEVPNGILLKPFSLGDLRATLQKYQTKRPTQSKSI